MSKVRMSWGLLLCLTLASGCVQTKYGWYDYDQKLYRHYRDPGQQEVFLEQLKEIVERGTSSNRIPPGLFAEYGYVLYETGKFNEATRYFDLEGKKWPESRVLMAKMVKNAQLRAGKAEGRVQ